MVKKRGGRLVVELDKKNLADIPVFKIDRIFAFGNVQFTTQALTMLLENNIDVAFFSYYGKYKGKISTDTSPNVFLRVAQFDRWRDNDFRIQFCKSIVEAKLSNMLAVLKRFNKNHPETDIKDSILSIRHGLENIESGESINYLRGVEGSSSGAYFSAFSKMLRQELQFSKRMKRPAPDPVNAMLSLGYVMVTNEIAHNLEGMAFEPFLGFLHGIKYGRKSLALDMVEEFRQPLVDQFVLKLANLKIFTSDNFEEIPGKGVYLHDESFKKYLEYYEERMNEIVKTDTGEQISWRRLIRKQSEELEKSLMENTNYQPFLYE